MQTIPVTIPETLFLAHSPDPTIDLLDAYRQDF